VEAKQEMKKSDRGDCFQSYQKREYKQTLDVSENVDIEQLTSSISQDGVLTISAPFLVLPEPEKHQKEEEAKLDVKADDEEPSKSSNQANENKSESSKEDGSNMNNEST